MDITPAILIFTTNLFVRLQRVLGMSSIQFGVMLIFNMCMEYDTAGRFGIVRILWY